MDYVGAILIPYWAIVEALKTCPKDFSGRDVYQGGSQCMVAKRAPCRTFGGVFDSVVISWIKPIVGGVKSLESYKTVKVSNPLCRLIFNPSWQEEI